MTDDSSPFKGRRLVHVPRVERVLWTRRKDRRVAEARLRDHPHGRELVFYVNDQLLWSRVFTDGDGALSAFAEDKRRVRGKGVARRCMRTRAITRQS